MRPVLLLLLFAVSGLSVNGQFSLKPQAGFENSFTKVRINNLPEFSIPSQLTPRLGVKLDFKTKQGHGAFAGVSTSRTLVAYDFTNPELAMSNFSTSSGKMQLRFESGYQFSTKRLFFNKAGKSQKEVSSLSQKVAQKSAEKSAQKSCGGYSARSHCGKKENLASRSNCGSKQNSLARHHKENFAKARKENNGWFMRVQPALGFAFIPSREPDLVTNSKAGQTSYTYNASNIRTALVMGSGFEFGNRSRAKFVVNLSYVKGLGSNEAILTTQNNSKTTTSRFNSKVGGWNATLGIPISLGRTKTVQPKVIEQRKKTECQQYRIIIRSKCGGKSA